MLTARVVTPRDQLIEENEMISYIEIDILHKVAKEGGRGDSHSATVATGSRAPTSACCHGHGIAVAFLFHGRKQRPDPASVQATCWSFKEIANEPEILDRNEKVLKS